MVSALAHAAQWWVCWKNCSIPHPVTCVWEMQLNCLFCEVSTAKVSLYEAQSVSFQLVCLFVMSGNSHHIVRGVSCQSQEVVREVWFTIKNAIHLGWSTAQFIVAYGGNTWISVLKSWEVLSLSQKARAKWDMGLHLNQLLIHHWGVGCAEEQVSVFVTNVQESLKIPFASTWTHVWMWLFIAKILPSTQSVFKLKFNNISLKNTTWSQCQSILNHWMQTLTDCVSGTLPLHTRGGAELFSYLHQVPVEPKALQALWKFFCVQRFLNENGAQLHWCMICKYVSFYTGWCGKNYFVQREVSWEVQHKAP